MKAERARDLSALALVAVAAVAVFSGTIGHALLWDDPILLTYAEKLVREGGIPGLLSAEFRLDPEGREPLGYYRPVVLASLWVDHLLSPALPQIFHLTNIVLHALNSCLVLLLLRSFVPVAAATFGALLFAVHPAHTESVAFVSGRTDLWAASFTLVAAVFWLRSRHPEGRGQALPWAALVVVGACTALGALSKETALLLPLVLLAWDFITARRRGSGPGWWVRNRAWAAAFAAAVLVVLALRFFVAEVGLSGTGSGVQKFKASHSGIVPSLFFNSLAAYARILVFPWPLNAFYTLDQIRPSLLSALAILLLAALAALPLPGGNARPVPVGRSFAFLWMVAFILPVSRLFPFGGAVVAERFLYLPSVGYSLLLALWADRMFSGSRPARVVTRGVGAALLILMAAGTVSRARVWRDPMTFFRDLTASSPAAYEGPGGLGTALLERGEVEQAISTFQEAVRRVPGNAKAWFNLGYALSRVGRWPEAKEAYRRSLAVEPGRVDTITNLGIAAAMERDYATAIPLFTQAVQADPTSAQAWYNLAVVQQKTGDSAAAVKSYGEVIRSMPSNAEARFRLGALLVARGDLAAARAQWEALRRIDTSLARQLQSLIEKAATPATR